MKQASRREPDKAVSQGSSAREKEPRLVLQPSHFATFQCNSPWSRQDECNVSRCGSHHDSCTTCSGAMGIVVRESNRLWGSVAKAGTKT
jgi:hypothetical protein